MDIGSVAVAGNAIEVAAVCAHVHVKLVRGVEHCHGYIAMFDVVATTGVGMTADAIFTSRNATVHRDTLCNDVEIDRLVGLASRFHALHVGAGLIVAHEAIDRFRVVEGECCVVVAITGMALGTAAFVRRYCDTEIIDEIVLAVHLALVAIDVRCNAFPREVRIFQHLIAYQSVAVQAGLGAFVVMLGEVTLVELLYLVGSAGIGVAVEYVDNTITVDVLLSGI